MEKNSTKSMVMIASAMLIFGTIGIFRRFIPLSSPVLACVRGVLGTLFLGGVMLAKKAAAKKHGKDDEALPKLGAKRLAGLIISGILIGINWILLFEAYNYTTVPVATLCYYMEPTIVIALSPLLFKERITLKKSLCAAAAVVGMIFVSGMVENGLPAVSEARGILCGLGAAAIYACVVIMNKKMPGIDAYQKTLIQLGSGAVVLLPYCLLTESVNVSEIGWQVVLLLLVVGLIHTGLAYALYFGSMDGLKAQTVAIFSYIDPVAALILAAVILGEALSVFGIIGAVLIIGAAMVSELKQG